MRISSVSAGLCDLLTPNLRIEVYNGGERQKRVQKSVVLCDKVWNCVTI